MGARDSGFRGRSLFFRFANGSDHIERAFRIILELVPENAFAAIERVFETDESSRNSAKLLGGKKRLRQKAFQPASARDGVAVFRGKLFQAEHRDDVLKRLILPHGLADL